MLKETLLSSDISLQQDLAEATGSDVTEVFCWSCLDTSQYSPNRLCLTGDTFRLACFMQLC
uniref:Uncharacterized protein n=1 Tax=Anguilla anguilla TaxID=7936 RepID=A0A0E9WN51_ANGAN